MAAISRNTLLAALPLAAALMAGVASLSPPPAHAAAGSDACDHVVDAVPATLSSPGTWCLAQDLTLTAELSHAFTIDADDVTLDCNDFRVTRAPSETGNGSSAVHGRDHDATVVRDCAFDGFNRGIYLTGTGGGHLVEGNFVHNAVTVGINVDGAGSVIRDNRVFAIPGIAGQNSATGIRFTGPVDVVGNIVAGVGGVVTDWSNATGILGVQAEGRIAGNLVRDVVSNGTSGRARLIWAQTSGRLEISENKLWGDGTTDTEAINCDNADASAHSNVIFDVAVPITGCEASGTNYLDGAYL